MKTKIKLLITILMLVIAALLSSQAGAIIAPYESSGTCCKSNSYDVCIWGGQQHPGYVSYVHGPCP